MKRFLLALLTIALGCGHPAQGIEVGGPTHDGVEVQVDMPLSLRKHNIGGSDGSGLCVFTSIQNAARCQHVTTLEDFQHFMSSRPGVGYPQKVDAMIAACAKQSSGGPVRYLQYQGTDPTPIRLALEAGRLPCITYDGRDKVHYSGHIEHMINCVYFSDKPDGLVAVLDNNFIGDDQLVWMTIPEFTSRWIGGAGRTGWMVLLLDPGVPPIPSIYSPPKGSEMNALLLSAAALLAAPGYDTSFAQYAPQPVAGAWGSCSTGSCSSCSSGSCPGGICPSGGCPNCPPAATRYMLHRLDGSYVPCDAQGVPLDAPAAKPVPAKSGCRCATNGGICPCIDGQCGDGLCPTAPRAGDDAPTPNFGLMPLKMSDIEHWTLDGQTVPRHEGFEAIRGGAPDLPQDKLLPWLVGYGLDAPTEALIKTAKGVRSVNYPIGSAMAMDRDGKQKWLSNAVCVLTADGATVGSVQAADVAEFVGRLNKLPEGWDASKLPDLLHPKPTPKPAPAPAPDGPDVSPAADDALPVLGLVALAIGGVAGGAYLLRKKV
jgi:hypothetical protein